MILGKFFRNPDDAETVFEGLETSSRQYEVLSTGQRFITINIPKHQSNEKMPGWFKLNTRSGRFFTIDGLNAYLQSTKQEKGAQIDWNKFPEGTLIIADRSGGADTLLLQLQDSKQ